MRTKFVRVRISYAYEIRMITKIRTRKNFVRGRTSYAYEVCKRANFVGRVLRPALGPQLYLILLVCFEWVAVPSVAKINGNSSGCSRRRRGSAAAAAAAAACAARWRHGKKIKIFAKTWKTRKLQKTIKQSIQVNKNIDF